MYMLSDSGDECYERYTTKSRRSVKQCRSKTLIDKEPVEIIDLCDIMPVSSCVSSISNKNVVSDTKDYSSSNLFLSDSMSDTEMTNSSKSKGKSKPSPAKRGRGKSRGRGTSRGRGRKQVMSVLLPPPTLTDYEKIVEPFSLSSNEVMSLLTPEPPKAAKRGKKRGRQSTQGSATKSAISSDGNGRGGRGRKRVRGGRTPLRQSTRPRIPIFNVGNCDEYPDSSEHQQLFTSSSQEQAVIDLDEDVHNEELSVKVYWQSVEVIKFSIRKLQKITQIFDFFMEREHVSTDQLLFTFNNNILRPDDTPDSINYNIAKFIEGGIVHTKLTLPTNVLEKKVVSNFKLKFQSQSMKRPLEISINETDKLQLGMIKCAEHLELPLAKLRFEFDGDIVRGNKTPADLDIASGDCIDVKIIN